MKQTEPPIYSLLIHKLEKHKFPPSLDGDKCAQLHNGAIDDCIAMLRQHEATARQHEELSLTDTNVAQREISVVDRALANAADILANFKSCEPHTDGTVERKLEEWQACYAKLFTQMNDLAQSRKPVSGEPVSLDSMARICFKVLRERHMQDYSDYDKILKDYDGIDNTSVGMITKAVLDAAGVVYVA